MSGEEPQDLGLAILPPGWAWTTLPTLSGETGTFTDGDWVESKDQDPDGEVRLVQLADVGDGFYRDRSSRFLTAEKASSLNCTFLETGDVLISRLADPIGRACIFPGDSRECVTVVDVALFRAAEAGKVDHGWVKSAINAQQFRGAIDQAASGTTRKRISRKNLGSLPLPMPPLNEQRRIVAKIEALQERSKAAKDALDAIPPLLEKFRQSVLAAAFRGDLTKSWRERQPEIEPATVLLDRIRAERRRRFSEANPKKKYVEPAPVDASDLPELPAGWCWASVEELCWDGPTNGYSGATTSGATGTLTMKLSATTQGRLRVDDSTTKRLNETISPGSKYWLRAGDLLVQRANSLAYLGAAAIFEDTAEPMVYPDLMMRLRTSTESHSRYLWHYFNGPSCRAWFRSKATGTAGNMPKINGETLRLTPVPVAPMSEVERLLQIIQELLDWDEAATTQSDSLLPLLGSLDQSILAKAFRGELVPQDPNDEPASVLLERIRAEREAAGPAKTKRRRST